jgi:hypothetical protein
MIDSVKEALCRLLLLFIHTYIHTRAHMLQDEMIDSVKEALCRSLLLLAAEPNTIVFLLSSERRDMLMQWLGEVQVCI